VGAYESSLGYLSDFADTMVLNLTAGYDSIMSADLAAEATNLAAAEIRQNSATAIVAQSNSLSKELVDFLLQSVVD
jgi:flagellin-like hook-associated protein FlgL